MRAGAFVPKPRPCLDSKTSEVRIYMARTVAELMTDIRHLTGV
jgi:hypothetical protein